MATIYYDNSEISTPSEYLTEQDSTDRETDSEDDIATSSSSGSSGSLTRTETNDSIEVINTSGLLDTSVGTVIGLLQKISLGPKVLKSLDSGEQTHANNSGVATPQLFTLEEAKKILANEKKTAQHEKIVKNINKVLSSNESKINDDPKGFGFRFLCLCIACAFGGRKGVARYDRSLPKDDITSIIPDITDCANRKRELNTSCMCYIGHIILYYWDKKSVRDALTRRFGSLRKVIRGKNNIVSEIGAKNLWMPKFHEVHSEKKREIIEEIEERFEKDSENFKKILLFFGIEM